MCVYVCNCGYVTICSKLNIHICVILVFTHVSYMGTMKREIEEERGLETVWDRKEEERKLPSGIAVQNKHRRGKERSQYGEVSS